MVHALPPGNPHQLGLEDGLGCLRWKAPQSEVASSTSRSSQMLILTHSCIHTDHKLPWVFFFSPVTLFNLYRSFCSSCIFQFESLVIIIIFFWLCGVQERKKKNVHNFFVIPDFSLLMWKSSIIFLKLARYFSDVPFQIKINSIQSLIRNPYTSSVWSKSSKTLKKK